MLPCKSSNRELNWKVPFRMFTQLERVWSSPWHQRLQEVLHTFIGHDHGMYPLQFSQQEWQLAEKGNKLPGPKHCVETGPWTILYTYGSKMFKGSVSLLKMLKRYCMSLQSFDFTEKSGYIKLSWYIITISIYNIYCIHVCVTHAYIRLCIYILYIYITYIYIHIMYRYIYIYVIYIYICQNTTWCSMVLLKILVWYTLAPSALRLGEGKFYEALGLHSGEALGVAGHRGGLAILSPVHWLFQRGTKKNCPNNYG